jgi:hypothetical protein
MQVFDFAGQMIDQSSRQNLEEAYVKYNAAHSANLAGGAFSLSDDPSDQLEGGAYLTRRGKLAQGTDEEYRNAMDAVRDRLTEKMNSREKFAFEQMTARVRETGLLTLRRNINDEMMRYTSDLTDSTLSTAAQANLTRTITAYQQRQSFIGGGLNMAERAASTTGNPEMLKASQDGLAQQSQADAVETINDWYTTNVAEMARAADFMRQQGMDETTVQWRSAEFLRKQGAEMAQSLIANGMHDQADLFLDHADKVGFDDKEKVGQLRSVNERMRAARNEKQAAVADDQAKAMTAEIASLAIKDPTLKTQRPSEYTVMLQQRAARTSDPRVLKDIESRIDEAQQFSAATIAKKEMERKRGMAAANAGDDSARQEAVRDKEALKAGFYLDDNNQPVYMHPAEIERIASVGYRKVNPDGTPHPSAFSPSDYEEIMKNASKQRDQRTEQFHQRISVDVLGQFKDPLKRIHDTFTINPEVKKLTPDTRIFTNEYKDAKGKKRREDVTAATLLQFMNVVNQQLALDPTMTPDAAVEKFKKLSAGTLQGYEDQTAADSLAAQAEILSKLRDNQAKALSPQKPVVVQ